VEPLSPLAVTEEGTTEKEEFLKRLATLEENYKVIEKFKKLSANILTRAKAAPSTDKKTLAEKRSSVQIALRTVTNIQKLVASLKAKSPYFLSDKKTVSLSWTSPPSGLGNDETIDEKFGRGRGRGRGRGIQNNSRVPGKSRVKILLAGNRNKQESKVKTTTTNVEENGQNEEETENSFPKRARTEKKSRRTIYVPPTRRKDSQQTKEEIPDSQQTKEIKSNDTEISPVQTEESTVDTTTVDTTTRVRRERPTKTIRTPVVNPKKRKGRGDFRKIMH